MRDIVALVGAGADRSLLTAGGPSANGSA
jgi:hypothetical protein